MRTPHFLLALIVLVTATGLSAMLVPLVRAVGRRLRVLDEPGHRKVHDEPTPRLGGVAVAAAFLTVVLVGYLMIPALQSTAALQAWIGAPLTLLRDASQVEAKLLALLAAAGVTFLVGLADDVFGSRFPVWAKVSGQALAAVIVIAGGIQTSLLPHPWMNALLTFLWLVGITNAFNLLDNMDGLSAGVAFVASSVLLINAWSLGEFFISLILLALMGSLLGFLFFNFNKASIFLGDCGSLFVGFLMGSLTLLERYVTKASSSYFPVLMPVVLLAIPLVDTATVIAIRLREGRPLYVGDTRHLSHRLVALGFSKREAVLFIYLATFCSGLGALFLTDASLGRSVLLLLQAAGFVTLLLLLMFVERRP